MLKHCADLQEKHFKYEFHTCTCSHTPFWMNSGDPYSSPTHTTQAAPHSTRVSVLQIS